MRACNHGADHIVVKPGKAQGFESLLVGLRLIPKIIDIESFEDLLQNALVQGFAGVQTLMAGNLEPAK